MNVLHPTNGASKLRIAFVGAVEGSGVAFDALVASGHAPVLLVTLPPEVSHRHSDFVDLGPRARAAGATVFHAADINAPATIEALQAAEPDLTLVVGWSQICREPFRAVARLGTLGYHPAPLPRFRGRAVIPWTILMDEEMSGSTLFWLDEGVDSGAIVAQRLFPISPEETARSLYDKHKQELVHLVPEAVARIAAGNLSATPQDHALATICARRTMEDGLVDWHAPAESVLRLVRAVGDPYPGAFTHSGPERLRLDAARPHAAAGRYIGLPGQVQSHTQAGFTVLCGDRRAIEVTAWDGLAGRRPKMHQRLMPA
jgi:methionyl-tRNA formyltransferase